MLMPNQGRRRGRCVDSTAEQIKLWEGGELLTYNQQPLPAPPTSIPVTCFLSVGSRWGKQGWA